MSYWIKSLPLLAQALKQMNPNGQSLSPPLMALFEDIELRMRRASGNVNFVPPYKDGEVVWTPMGERIETVIEGDRTHVKNLIDDMVLLEDAHIALRDQGQGTFSVKLDEWKKSIHQRVGEDVVAKMDSLP